MGGGGGFGMEVEEGVDGCGWAEERGEEEGEAEEEGW